MRPPDHHVVGPPGELLDVGAVVGQGNGTAEVANVTVVHVRDALEVLGGKKKNQYNLKKFWKIKYGSAMTFFLDKRLDKIMSSIEKSVEESAIKTIWEVEVATVKQENKVLYAFVIERF